MPTTSFQPMPDCVEASAPAAEDRELAAPCPGPVDGSFADRARQLVAFLTEGPRLPGVLRRHEQELGEWISRWRGAPLHGAATAQHFVAEELGIIMRALNGPPGGGARIRDASNERLCWLIARCMADAR